MIEDKDSNTLMMSESLKGTVPELEGQAASPRIDSSIIYAFLGLYSQDYSEPIAGRAVGFSLEKTGDVKVDLRVKTAEAYEFFKKHATSRLSCGMLYLYLGDDEICLDGPYEISNPRIFDIDPQNKVCVLGVDLIKA